MKARFEIKPGQTYHRLTIVKEGPKIAYSNRRTWFCRCACGKTLTIRSDNVGKTKSCSGCWFVGEERPTDQIQERKMRAMYSPHRASYMPEYMVWHSMIARCKDENNASYRRYGGRGIKVCKRWERFDLFLKDMGKRPTPKHSLDRINYNGDYKKSNCRWVTRDVQDRNRENNHRLTFKGETLTIAGWAERLGVSQGLILERIRRGWSVEKTLTAPVGLKITALGKTMSAAEWSDISGVTAYLILNRIRQGWKPEDAIMRPTRFHPNQIVKS